VHETPTWKKIIFLSFRATADTGGDVRLGNHIWMVTNDIPEIANYFKIHRKFSSGSFGSVYTASLKCYPNKLFAIKHIVPCCAPRRIQNEIQFLSSICSKYVISLQSFIRHNDHVALIMPFFNHDSFQDYVRVLSIEEIQVYMKSLFSALTAVHAHGIIHYDVKPNNVLFHRKTRILKLIDFGLSHKASNNASGIVEHSVRNISEYVSLQCCKHSTSEVCTSCMTKPNQKASRAGTSGFRAFEMLLKYCDQSTAIDIWSAGIIFLCLLSGKYPFFRAKDDSTAVMQIMSLFGSQNCVEVATLLGKEMYISPQIQSQNLCNICEQLRKNAFTKYTDGILHYTHWVIAPSSAYKLLQDCLNLNPMQRITAQKALTHPFFTE